MSRRPDSAERAGTSMTINHLYLRVRDLETSHAFYRDLFGFDGAREWQGATCVVRNAVGFVLALTPDPVPPTWPAGLHFGFLLDDVSNARAVRERVVGAGHRIVEAYEEDGFVVFTPSDPDGYLIGVEAGVPSFPPPP